MDETEVVPWHGVLAPEGVMSGDRRRFEPESLRHRELPLPLLYQDATAEGHDGAVRVGRIDGISRHVGEGNPLIRAWGVIDTHDTAIEAARQLKEGMLRGVSVDVDDATFEFRDEDNQPLGEEVSPFEVEKPIMAVTDGRIAAATMVSIPAFEEAFIALGQPPEDWEITVESGTDEHMLEDVAAEDDTFATVSDKPWSDFTESDYNDDQWYRATVLHRNGNSRVKSDNVLPIREPDGTLNRNGVHAAASRFNQVDAPAEAKSAAKSALRGAYKALGEEPPEALAAAMAPAFLSAPSLVASGYMSDFADPLLDGPTPLTVTEDGRVYGHLATWGTCHIAFTGQCITPPHSVTNYAHFLTGEVLTSDGASIPTGRITLGTGHADPTLNAAAAIAHYDDTGTAVADVSAGEDEYGIWLAGRLRSTLSAQQIEILRASPPSGDWRRRGGNLELVAALAVNVAGFPVPRVKMAMVAGAQQSLVAAGIVTHHREDLPPGWVQALTAVLREERAQQRRAARAARIAASIQRDLPSRAQQAVALVHAE